VYRAGASAVRTYLTANAAISASVNSRCAQGVVQKLRLVVQMMRRPDERHIECRPAVPVHGTWHEPYHVVRRTNREITQSDANTMAEHRTERPEASNLHHLGTLALWP
jgi:hypothetical protein